MKYGLLIAGLLFLFAVEILRIYFIMPFPGSQHNNTIQLAYWLNRYTIWLRIAGLLLIAWPVIYIMQHARFWKKGVLAAGLLFYVVVFYFFNFRFQADKMFYQPRHKNFAAAATNTIPAGKLVIGVSLNGQAKAYPIQLIGYHHQVRDTIGNTPVMVTYCTVCRTGRVYSPAVNGRPETFRLVGMDHFNAMFEDAGTKSWWQQATGTAVAGPLQGTALPEIPSRQLTLEAWLKTYPASLIMQPDTLFTKQYNELKDFDRGTIKSSLEKRDSGSWQFKSWVIGISHNNINKAYDWNALVKQTIIQDSIAGLPVALVLENDSATFHVWNRTVNNQTLHFENTGHLLKDRNTQSTWNRNGECIDGVLKGQQLLPVQSYQEFWHSWRTFHPTTLQYK